ncbi:MAG: cation diffusion facilitator family transporter [Myxococcales bacterium]|nr:cation diffusion facilitator family transporter [Myxococcales bacterium]
MPENRPSTGPFIAALAGNSLIAAAKFVAAAFTGSSVMIAEGVHSIVDSTNNVLMLVGARCSDAKPSPEHPFGHGKELYFWSLIVALVIFSAGGGISIYEGITHVLHPSPVENPLWNYGVLGVSFVADGTTLVIAYREFKPHKGKRSLWRAIRVSKDPTKFAVVLEDGAATIGLFIAAVGLLATQLTGSGIYDGLASIAVGLLLCAIAFVLALESKNLLLGEAAAPRVVADLRETVCRDPDVEGVASLLTMHLGPYDLLLNVDVAFREDLTGNETVAAIQRIERAIQRSHPEVKRIFIEAGSLDRTQPGAPSPPQSPGS